MKFCHALAALVLVNCVTVANADEYLHKASGLQFELPAGWEVSEQGDKINLHNEDKTLWVVGGVIEKEAAQEILHDIQKFLDKLEGLDDVEVSDGPEKEEVNGLEQAWYEGTATVKGDNGKPTEIEWDMTVVSGGKKILFLVGMGKLDDNEEVYEEFFESIEAVADAAE